MDDRPDFWTKKYTFKEWLDYLHDGNFGVAPISWINRPKEKGLKSLFGGKKAHICEASGYKCGGENDGN